MSSVRSTKVGTVASHLITTLSLSPVWSTPVPLSSLAATKDSVCQAGLIGIHMVHWLLWLHHITTIYTTD